MGALVYGNPDDDLIHLNDITLWTGKPVDHNEGAGAAQWLPKIREALFNEDYATADSLQHHLQGHNSSFYQPLATIHIIDDNDKADYVIVSAANWIYNMDYNELIDAHVASGADITVVTQAARDKDVDVCTFEIADGRVKGIKHGAVFGETAFLDCFVVGREKFLEILDWYAANDYLDLFEALAGEYDRVNVQAYDFDGYAAPIFNKDTYFKANMDMLDPKITHELFSIRPIATKAHDNQPAKFVTGAKVSNSRISGSCRIYGTVSNSILGRGVIVEKGAVVENAIIMQGCTIKSGAHVQYAIVDRNNEVPEGTELCGTEAAILIKDKA